MKLESFCLEVVKENMTLMISQIHQCSRFSKEKPIEGAFISKPFTSIQVPFPRKEIKMHLATKMLRNVTEKQKTKTKKRLFWQKKLQK